LRILPLGKEQDFLGQHPELEAIIQEILDDAVKHGIIDALPVRKKDF